MQRILSALILAVMFLCATVPLKAAELKASTAKAFGRYVQAAEARMDSELKSRYPFLWVDRLPNVERAAAYSRLRGGEILIESRAAGRNIPGGMVHDWVGIVFIPKATLDETLAQIQDYDNDYRTYAPQIVRSKVLERNGDQFTISLRFQKKGLATVVLDLVNHVQFFRMDQSRAYSRTESIRITEIDHPGTSQEHEEAPGKGHGYLWRLNDYVRYEQSAEGVFVQIEAIALSRNIPLGLGWLIKPFVTRVPQESMNFTLSRIRDSVENVEPSWPIRQQRPSETQTLR